MPRGARIRVPTGPNPGRDWADDAACAGADPAIFFPKLGQSGDQARQYCERCPVREPCLEWAVSAQEPYGIWGGTSELERRAIRHARAS